MLLIHFCLLIALVPFIESRIQCSGNIRCSSSFPVCCDGFCVSGGDFCCANKNSDSGRSCDPGTTCCHVAGVAQCCQLGETCRDGIGCQPDICGELNDPWRCVSEKLTNRLNEEVSCAWCTTNRHCMDAKIADASCPPPSTKANVGLRGYLIKKLSDPINDRCSLRFTCDSCIGGTSELNGQGEPCNWCASTQTCMARGMILNESINYQCSDKFSTVKTKDQCNAILLHGSGLVHATEMSLTSIAAILLLTMGSLCGVGVLWVVIRTARASYFARTKPALSTLVTFYRSGVPILEDTASGSDDTQQSVGDALLNAQVSTMVIVCALCGKETGNERKRTRDSSHPGDMWTFAILLPCTHTLCKNCLRTGNLALRRRPWWATKTALKLKAAGSRWFDKLFGANPYKKSTRRELSSDSSAPVCENDSVNEAGVLKALGSDRRCAVCFQVCEAVLIPGKLMT